MEESLVSITDPQGVIVCVNEMFCHTSGYARAEIIGQTHRLIKHPDTDLATHHSLWSRIVHQKRWRGVIKNMTKDQCPYYIDLTITPIVVRGELIGFRASGINITAQYMFGLSSD